MDFLSDGVFSLDGQTGQIKQLKPVDREMFPQHHITIQVCSTFEILEVNVSRASEMVFMKKNQAI